MSPHLAQLLGRAFAHGEARRANELIDRTRAQVKQRVGAAVNYEVSLLQRGWEHLEQHVAPRLALYLKSKRMSVQSCAPLFLSIFHGETLYFVSAPDFYDVVRAASGLDERAFNQRARLWERTGQSHSGLLPAVNP